MNPIDRLFEKLRSEGRKAFIPFLTTGDPDVRATITIAQEMVRRGASLIEIGFPYSDAIADGPVIQASYTRALDNGLSLDDVFNCARTIAQSSGVPIVGMTSYSLMHRRGIERFLDQCIDAGLSGAIVPDLPFEESESLRQSAHERAFKLIQLVTPTTPRDRAIEIAMGSTGFLYCVSITGITGEREQLPAELKDQLTWLRQQTDLPLCVGFGIKCPEQVRMLRDHVDGVIVGSAFVRRLEQIGTRTLEEVTQNVGELVTSLVDAL